MGTEDIEAPNRMISVQTTEQRATEAAWVVVHPQHVPASQVGREHSAKLTRVVISATGGAEAHRLTAKRIAAEDVEKVLRGEAKEHASLQCSQRQQQP